jgi:hypothetical protein
MSGETEFYTPGEARELGEALETLRGGREEVLRDWMERVRDNRTVTTEETLPDPLLLDHMPQLFDAILDRLEINRPREDAEQFAAIHGFARRLSGYRLAETVLELLMFRRAIWSYLTAVGARARGAFAAMELIDGMVDRAVLASLNAFMDPAARMLSRTGGGGVGDAALEDGGDG